jgi:hypothetical protein
MSLREEIIDALKKNAPGLDIVALGKKLGLEWNDSNLQYEIARLRHDGIVGRSGKKNTIYEPDGSPGFIPILILK